MKNVLFVFAITLLLFSCKKDKEVAPSETAHDITLKVYHGSLNHKQATDTTVGGKFYSTYYYTVPVVESSLSGVQVKLFEDGKLIKNTYTDANGEYTFSGLNEKGNYKYILTSPTYNDGYGPYHYFAEATLDVLHSEISNYYYIHFEYGHGYVSE